MNTSKFSLEFELNVAEIQKLNKMYYKDLYKESCLLYTSDAADEGLGVDLGGRRIIKKN